MKTILVPTLVLGVVLTLGGCESPGSTGVDPIDRASSAVVEPPTPDEQPPLAGAAALPGLRYRPAPTWVPVKPQRPTRVAEYTVPGSAPQRDATLIVYYFGPRGAGPAQANLDRWCDQLAQPDGRPTREVATIARRDVDGMAVHTLDASGDYVAETFPGSGERLDEPAHRLLAAIVETPAGPYYFKLLGPEATVDEVAGEYDALLASLEAAEAPSRAGLPPGHP